MLLIAFFAATALVAFRSYTGNVAALLATCFLFANLLHEHAMQLLKTRWIVGAAVMTGATLVLTPACRSQADTRDREKLPRLDELCHAPKPTVVIFTSESCGWCERLKEKTLTDPKVTRRLEKYAVEFVDIEERDDLALKAHITLTPAVFAISPACRTVDSFTGYIQPGVFIDWLDRAEQQ
jgi:thioredoxin-related protein